MAIPVSLLIFSGCGEKEVEVPVAEVEEPFTEATPPPPPSPTPESPVAEATPPPPEPRFLPEGEFVIVKRVSVVTDSGIVGAAPGTRVRLVSGSGEKMIVATGHAEFEVTSEHVTNDLDIIEELDAKITAGRPATPPDNSQPASFHQPQPDMPPPAAPKAPAVSDLAERRAKLNQQIEQVDQSIRAMRDKLRELNDQQFRGLKSIHGSYKASQLARDRNTPEESRINGLLQKAEAQRNALEQQRRNLK